MGIQGDTDLHFWLTRSVARCIGLSFRTAMDRGRLSPDDYLELVQACRGCPHVTQCQHWLGGQGVRPHKRAPDFCPNGPALDALKHD